MDDQPQSTDGQDGRTELELELVVQIGEEFVGRLDVDPLRRIIETALSNEGIHRKVELSLVVTDDEEIRQLNLAYRGIDRPTDVLSFPLQPKLGKRGVRFVTPPDDVVHLGDVVISFPRAVEQAQEYGHSLERELGYLTVHGALHLLGYEHKNKAGREQMRAKEESALAGLPR